jgi:cellulose synthase (UDP-forming)
MKLNYKKEILLTKFLMLITIAASIFFSIEIFTQLITFIRQENTFGIFKLILFIAIVAYLIYGNVLYQLTRIGYYARLLKHKEVDLEILFNTFAYKAIPPKVTILIPSYKEDLPIVRQTILSTALQEYPNKRIVLLIDDPQHSHKKEDEKNLQATRQLPGDLQFIFNYEAVKYEKALDKFLQKQKNNLIETQEEVKNLIALYTQATEWFDHFINRYPIQDHQEKLLEEKVFHKLLKTYKLKIQQLYQLLASSKQSIAAEELLHEYKRLASLFRVEITSFERRSYINLSHEPNKAANLNSYISLIGKSFKQVKSDTGLYYLSRQSEGETPSIPDTDYVLTLDADSILLPEYILRLVYYMEQPENKKVAVIQTPYSANPVASNPIERLAGATTDIQYIIHQGFTYYNATFWVGANALIRKQALNEIAEKERHGSFNIIKYIQDRTVIEDTESTIDLIHKGWKLYNYPARLAHSATPPDFGSLLIQRRRWANGGFIILPKLLKYLFLKPYKRGKTREGFMRFHYLTSIGFVSLGILLLLLVPFGDSSNSIWLPFTALPYYLLYARDLRLCGYKVSDIFRVYAFNLMLIPINLGGFLKSLQQGITGKKIPFGRTPKVQGRTAAPAVYILTEYLLLLYCLFAFTFDIYHSFFTHAIYSFINACFFVYVLTKYLGWKKSIEDLVNRTS